MFKKLCVFLLIFISYSVIAQPGHWMPTAKEIDSIVVEGNDDGQALIIIKGGVPSDFIPSGCSSPYNTIRLNTDKGKAMYSMALAAHSSGKKVKLALSCIGSRPLITHIWIF